LTSSIARQKRQDLLAFFVLQPRKSGRVAYERIRRRTDIDREEARCDVFDCIEMFYNPKRRHGYANRRSSVEFEKHYFNLLESV